MRTERATAPLQLAAINGWRGPGAIAIALAHLGVATDFFPYRLLEPVAPLVDLFFVLSGLVIAQAYGDKLASPAALPEYVIRRFGRIWPVQAATLGALVAYEGIKLAVESVTAYRFSSAPFGSAGINLAEAIPTNLLLVQSLGLHDRQTWNFPSWSLSVEFATYVTFALYCLVTPRLRALLGLAVIVGSVAVLATLAPFGMRSTYDYGLFRCLAGFYAGALCFDLARSGHLPHWRYPTLVEGVALAGTLVWLAWSARTAAAFAAPLVFALFVLAFADGRGRLSRVMAAPLFQRLAEWSFSIYMVHALVLIGLLAMLHVIAAHFHLSLFTHIANPIATLPGARADIEVIHIDSMVLRIVMPLVYLGTVMGAAILIHRAIEVPGRSLFARWGRQASKRPAHRLARQLDAAEGTP